MNKDTKRQLENSLKRFWKNKQRLEGLYVAAEKIEKEIREFRGILAEKEDLLPSPGQMRFTPGGGHGGSSEFTPIERASYMYEMNQAKIFEKIQNLRKIKIKLKCRIMQLESKIDWVEYIANTHLDDFEKAVFEQCYLYQRSNIGVGITLNCGEATVRRTRERILSRFHEFLKVRA
ncbi:hypothetical protein SAMN00017405_0409 [Desulfonispora thiosulfatigenes DSM 11270]|uniref:Phage transcriptional activator, RinA family n=1 Tax=Desulfonispora thiosulfatigenes DSM 11270 TaxID=656914 RepID=A0A1W1VQB9_DESTI|nr:hypothetical protein [Desulfonispora thiosulfatigenes]SMB95463.1 hypothetical protein SAMN00017405_0409 [Desulfonispora thiosulfatigenes DSM 11270]